MVRLKSLLPPELYADLAAHFERTQRFFSSQSPVQPQAVILGGGYGRAEGGVYYDTTGKAQLYNDLDYFIFTDQPNNPALLAAVNEWEMAESRRLGIDVEGKCLPRSDVEAVEHSMMFYDLVAGHLVVMGPENFLADFAVRLDPSKIDPVETTRLLWNRGSGLYFAQCDLADGKNLATVHRNQSKAKLAIGDAYLAIRGQYTSLAAERNARLRTAPELPPRVLELHDAGLAFKRHPTKTPELAQLEAEQKDLCALWLTTFLHVESERLQTSLTHPWEYADYSGRLYPGESRLRNGLLAIRDRLQRGGVLRPLGDYPRGALQRALVLLLSANPEATMQAGYYLGLKSKRKDDFSIAYRRWWALYS